MISARIIADSINERRERITTFVLVYPRFIHSELMTHRMFSRNAASSRAIPIGKMIAAVVDDPAIPYYWGANQSGMQAREQLSKKDIERAKAEWLRARDSAVAHVRELNKIGLHKQIANRILEPWMHMQTIVTATEYQNFFEQRCHPDAQPELHRLAMAMRNLYTKQVPISTNFHLPYNDDLHGTPIVRWARSVAKCARVSYTKHDDESTKAKDLELCARLINSGHWSPFEHVAFASPRKRHANLIGWQSLRESPDHMEQLKRTLTEANQ